MRRQRYLVWLTSLLIGLGICVLAQMSLPVALADDVTQPSFEPYLPSFREHPLPESLAAWRDFGRTGDYFSEILPTELGYLVWSQFPVQIYIDSCSPNEPAANRCSIWLHAVNQAIAEWGDYLPLAIASSEDSADISIWANMPSLEQRGLSRDDLLNANYRVRSAETRYEFRVQHVIDEVPILTQRFDIFLSPGQTENYIQAGARHELGHALGIWGHSPVETDALYFSQVRHSPAISSRDINTLKKIYQQPTQLGWALPLRNGND